MCLSNFIIVVYNQLSNVINKSKIGNLKVIGNYIIDYIYIYIYCWRVSTTLAVLTVYNENTS